MKVLSVTSECVPLIKTGGLADVVGALPAALSPHGVEMRVMLPGYRGLSKMLDGTTAVEVPLARGRRATVLTGRAAGIQIALVDAPGYFDRPGNPYVGEDGRDWPDNAARFGLLNEVAAAAAANGLDGWMPDAVHAHDWQSGLVPAYLRLQDRQPPVLLTIHNIAFQGTFPVETIEQLGLPREMMVPEALEFWGSLGFLKGGLALANRVSTVSPTYAEELLTPNFGMGLEGLLQHRRADLQGILNGIDDTTWDPQADIHTAAPYSAEGLAGKAVNRAALADRFKLDPSPDAPIYIVVSRLSTQKGLDLLLDAFPAILGSGGCLAVLGSGDAELENRFSNAAASNPGRVGTVIGYDEALSHLMQAGGDAILIPSRFEPCGLTQMYALRYGTLPVVARTGGLADTVIHANAAALAAGVATGFQHDPGSSAALARVLSQSAALFRKPDVWASLQANAMRQDVSWSKSAAEYARLYAGLLSS